MGILKTLFHKREPGRKPDRKLEEQLRQKYEAFRHLLADNQEVLEIITDLEEKTHGDYIFDIQYLRASIKQLSEKVYSLIHLLNEISGLRYGQLYGIYEQIHQELLDLLAKKRHIPVDALTLSFDRITVDKEDSVGGKMANLGELRNRLGLPVPAGFAV
ncbi:MAG: hypothetical protein C0407_18350, partial [Desulfobacca sp.]|nr:hypothetical protein [Desulfobacca sp.]